MRKFYLLLFSLLVYQLSLCQESAVYKIVKNYFRSNPFSNEFGDFLSFLINDPTIKNKVIQKKTDSTLFFFQGTYSTHNPFFFKPQKVDVILSEITLPIDSLAPDTLFTYQLLAYSNNSKDGVQELKKEFEKIYKHYKNNFLSNQYSDNSADIKMPGESYNFFDGFHVVSPFAVSWFGPDENKELCLVLTIRMAVYRNQAILPIPFFKIPETKADRQPGSSDQ